MKKQTAAVMSAVTLISSVNVPVVPAFAMGNQEEVQEIIEQNETEQIVGPVAEAGIGEEVFEETAEETTQEVIEETEITNEDIKEDEVIEGTTEESTQETDSEELTEDAIGDVSIGEGNEEKVDKDSTEDVKQEESIIEEEETEDVLIGTENLTESKGENKELEAEVQVQEEVDIPDRVLRKAINKALGRYDELDHPITQSELGSLTGLAYYSWQEDDSKISNLTGLEYATNLKSLFLSDNQISNLEPLANLTNLTDLFLSGNQISDFSPVDHVDYLSASNQVIYLEPQQINKGDTVTINNPLLGKIFEESGVYDDGITVPTGSYDKANNQIVWENVTTHHLQFTFKSFGDEVNGVVFVPVEFIDGEVEEEIINIPDSTLQSMINKQLGRSQEPTHPITKGEIEQILELDGYNDEEISDLTGLEYAINLNVLGIWYKGSDLTALGNLTNLTHLAIIGGSYEEGILHRGAIKDLNVLSNLTKLERLSVTGTNISDLTPIANLNNLQYLYLDMNQISDISVISNFTNLKELILCGNQIKDLTPLDALSSLENLDISGQEIKLDPIYVQQGGTVVIDNPLVGEWWNMKDIWDETTIYDIGFRVENGNYDVKNNQFVWENVKDSLLTFSFGNSQNDFEEWGKGSARGYWGWNQVSGTVTIPVIFEGQSEQHPNQPEQTEQPGDQSGQQPENKPVEEKPITTTPNVTKPTTQQNATSQHPQTGLSGFMGIIGVGALSLAAVITRRKKK